MQTPTKTIISLAVLLLAGANCAARGGPAAPASQPEPAKAAAASSSATTASAASASTATATNNAADEVDKDINPFTGQSLSEAQLRRTLEREKLITAIASEKTKQTQSNSELQMAKLRNVAEKSRFASEVKVIAPVPIAPLPAAQSPSKSRPLASPAAPTMPWSDVAGANAGTVQFAGPALSAVPRAEIRFADEVVELKSGPARNPSVVASVDAQRTAEQNQPRAINPIAVAPVALPPVQTMNSTPIVPPPQLPGR